MAKKQYVKYYLHLIQRKQKKVIQFDDKGNVKVYASVYKPESTNTELLPIETEREWKIIETILESIQEENEKNN